MVENKIITIVTSPFEIGVGGFYRSRKILPLLGKLLSKEGFSVNVVIPYNSLRAVFKFFLSRKQDIQYIRNPYVLFEEFILNELNKIEKESSYSVKFDSSVYNFLRYFGEKIQTKIDKTFISNILYSKLEQFKLKESLTALIERNMCSELKKRETDYVYITNESIDSLILLNCFSIKKGALTLFHNSIGEHKFDYILGIKTLEKVAEKKLLKGILMLSPAPIVERPQLLSLVSSEKIRLVYPGNALDLDIKNFSDIKKEKNTAIYVGRLALEKGFIDLIKAWSLVSKKVDAKLTIIGKVQSRVIIEEIRKLKNWKLKNVNYLGYIDNRERMLRIMARNELLVLPSYREGYSLVTLESLGLKMKIVSYDIPAIKYIYKGCKDVYTTPLGDINKLSLEIIKSFERERKGCHSLLTIHSSWKNVAQKEFEIIKELM